ncbi:hypothetical protein J6590_013821 [Homalodisca vitripennis]|nr:hypothetical protein J6590_095930 [Homalodisca vitripennis]KAG8293671.1 hypothetical protein J6590_013821 [Homalodisca vitripennis]
MGVINTPFSYFHDIIDRSESTTSERAFLPLANVEGTLNGALRMTIISGYLTGSIIINRNAQEPLLSDLVTSITTDRQLKPAFTHLINYLKSADNAMYSEVLQRMGIIRISFNTYD